eukprot:gene11500-34217_t
MADASEQEAVEGVKRAGPPSLPAAPAASPIKPPGAAPHTAARPPVTQAPPKGAAVPPNTLSPSERMAAVLTLASRGLLGQGAAALTNPALGLAGQPQLRHFDLIEMIGDTTKGVSVDQAVVLQKAIRSLSDAQMANNLGALATLSPVQLQDLLAKQGVNVREVVGKLVRHIDPAKAMTHFGPTFYFGPRAQPPSSTGTSTASASYAGGQGAPPTAQPHPALQAHQGAKPPAAAHLSASHATSDGAGSGGGGATSSARADPGGRPATSADANRGGGALPKGTQGAGAEPDPAPPEPPPNEPLETTMKRFPAGSVKRAIFEVLVRGGASGLSIHDIWSSLQVRGFSGSWQDPMAAKSYIAATCAQEAAFCRCGQGIYAIRTIVAETTGAPPPFKMPSLPRFRPASTTTATSTTKAQSSAKGGAATLLAKDPHRSTAGGAAPPHAQGPQGGMGKGTGYSSAAGAKPQVQASAYAAPGGLSPALQQANMAAAVAAVAAQTTAAAAAAGLRGPQVAAVLPPGSSSSRTEGTPQAEALQATAARTLLVAQQAAAHAVALQQQHKAEALQAAAARTLLVAQKAAAHAVALQQQHKANSQAMLTGHPPGQLGHAGDAVAAGRMLNQAVQPAVDDPVCVVQEGAVPTAHLDLKRDAALRNTLKCVQCYKTLNSNFSPLCLCDYCPRAYHLSCLCEEAMGNPSPELYVPLDQSLWACPICMERHTFGVPSKRRRGEKDAPVVAEVVVEVVEEAVVEEEEEEDDEEEVLKRMEEKEERDRKKAEAVVVEEVVVEEEEEGVLKRMEEKEERDRNKVEERLERQALRVRVNEERERMKEMVEERLERQALRVRVNEERERLKEMARRASRHEVEERLERQALRVRVNEERERMKEMARRASRQEVDDLEALDEERLDLIRLEPLLEEFRSRAENGVDPKGAEVAVLQELAQVAVSNSDPNAPTLLALAEAARDKKNTLAVNRGPPLPVAA